MLVATWGAVKLVMWRFWNAYIDEACALVAPDEFNSAGKTYQGFNVAALRTDLSYLRIPAAA